MTNANVNMNIDDLLDGTLDDLSDMPEFKPFPIGIHRMTINWDGPKEVSGVPSIELKLTIIETAELKNPTDTPPKAGDTTNILFMLKRKEGDTLVKNELGEGQFKAVLAAIKPAFDASLSNRQLMEESQGFEILGATGHRINKTDKSKIYTTLDNIVLL